MNRPLQELYDHCIAELEYHTRKRDIAKAGGNSEMRMRHDCGIESYTDVLTQLAIRYADQLDSVVPPAQPVPTPEVSPPAPVAPEEMEPLRWRESDDSRNDFGGAMAVNWKVYRAASSVVKSDDGHLMYCVTNSTKGWRISNSHDLLVASLSENERFQTFLSPGAAKMFCVQLEKKAFEALTPDP